MGLYRKCLLSGTTSEAPGKPPIACAHASTKKMIESRRRQKAAEGPGDDWAPVVRAMHVGASPASSAILLFYRTFVLIPTCKPIHRCLRRAGMRADLASPETVWLWAGWKFACGWYEMEPFTVDPSGSHVPAFESRPETSVPWPTPPG